mmetsp:Transcript_13980/g.20652  ORF Transcript_13980/g.20652 Transcript_13980/m.20652 type:complete len:720 (-) Transcript_13980:265-2424(-)
MGPNKKNNKQKKILHKTEDDIDERFVAALNRPQFQAPKEEKQKVVLDERFASVLTDSRFSVQTKDKYGRKMKKGVSSETDLKEFYMIEKKDRIGSVASGREDTSAEEESKEAQDPASRISYLTALSRGELDISESSSSDDDSECSSAQEEDHLNENAGVLDPSTKEEEDQISLTDVPSRFMAVMNVDWEKIRAVDLFAILSSFTAPGAVRKVQVYSSDYGMEKIEKEKTHGPADLWKQTTHDTIEINKDEIIESDDSEEANNEKITYRTVEDYTDTDFDPEKLRAYEVSKLKYYFSVVEFTSLEQADIAYKEIDGMEFEHSSSSIDMRSIHPDHLIGVTQNRKVRDEALSLPSNYEPPEFVVNALQRTNVECTWDEGNAERQQKLTSYANSERWEELGEGDDFNAYIASDQSSDDDSESRSSGNKKNSKLRMLLGLDDEEEEEGSHSIEDSVISDSEESSSGAKEVSFIPGQKSLEEKIREKIEKKTEKELTPWEKYQEKRKQKRRERRQAVRRQRSEIERDSEIKSSRSLIESDDYFLDGGGESKIRDKKSKKTDKHRSAEEHSESRVPSSKDELALLVAGEEDDEDLKDYNMHGLIKIDKLKGKALKGARKRKKEKLVANVAGSGFKIDTEDPRFAAVLQGTDDRFGIDRTDSKYKDTEAMRDILTEQTKNRNARKRAKRTTVVPDVSAESMTLNTVGGAAALSSLVSSIKSKVAKK